MRGVLRIAFAAPLLTIGLGAASAVAHVGPAKPLCAQAADTNHVGIVVEHGNGDVVTQCVGFDTPTITALAVLQAAASQDSSFEYATETYPGLGEAVCQIGNEPQQYTQCLPSSGSYWVFFTATSGRAWTGAAHGISTATVSNGDDVGFRYDALTGGDPAPASPANVCPATPPSPTPTPAPTASARPTPGGTSPPGPSGTAVPKPTGTVIATGAGGSSAPTASNSALPADGVLGASTPQASPVPALGVATNAVIDSPFNPALVIAVIAIAALITLVGIQGLRRRRQ
ncbi:MAG TPA: hypothetical protein VI434_03735 [Candidatus Dormibacteraeota bacterium]